jgi:hypothetical protein
MAEFEFMLDRIAAHKIDERIEQTKRSRIPRRRRHRRHALATGLHNLANRLDV